MKTRKKWTEGLGEIVETAVSGKSLLAHASGANPRYQRFDSGDRGGDRCRKGKLGDRPAVMIRFGSVRQQISCRKNSRGRWFPPLRMDIHLPCLRRSPRW